MRKKCLIILLLLLIIPNHIYASRDLDYVGVLVQSANTDRTINIKSDDGLFIYDKNTMEIIEDLDIEEVYIKIKDDKLEIFDKDEEFIEEMNLETEVIGGENENSIVKVGSNSFRGYIYFTLQGNKMNIVNYLKTDYYLFGVVPREIPASSGKEALKAQATVARSYVYANMDKHASSGYNICNTVHCQVYGGYLAEQESTNQAVLETSGEYVTYNGEIISTFYHSNSGGHTEDSKNVWGGNLEYLKGVDDPYSLNANHSNWTVKFTRKDIESKLKSGGVNVGNLRDLVIEETSPSKRVKKLRVVGDKKEVTITGDQFRNIMGTTSFRSTLFTIEEIETNDKDDYDKSGKQFIINGNKDKLERKIDNYYLVNSKGELVKKSGSIYVINDRGLKKIENKEKVENISENIIINGKGYGHGVGMSQYGAMEMAKQGFNYEEIIKHYYTGVEINNKRR